MFELGLSLGVVGVFVAIVLVMASVPVLTLIATGYWMTGVGLLAGVLAGIGYHVTMYRGLAGKEAPRWWWSPVRHHVLLSAEAYRRVRPWFVAGVSGAALSLAGCALLVVCLLRLQ